MGCVYLVALQYLTLACTHARPHTHTVILSEMLLSWSSLSLPAGQALKKTTVEDLFFFSCIFFC